MYFGMEPTMAQPLSFETPLVLKKQLDLLESLFLEQQQQPKT
jgi:hypothetical protein